MQSYSEFLLQLDKTKNKEIYARVIALTLDETPVEIIEGRITSGSINIDGASAVRRTCSLTVIANEFDYSNYTWSLNTKFKLEIGVKNNINFLYPDIIWFKQGIFVLTSFTVSRNTTSFNINLSGKDKMCLLNGENGGVLETSIDFGTIQEENDNGDWVITKIPLVDIIRNAVHVYGGEPYHNIIINDLDLQGKELLEYRYDTPMYLWRSAIEGSSPIYENAMMENNEVNLYLTNGSTTPVKMSDLTTEYLEPLVTTLNNFSEQITKPVYTKENGIYIPWYFTKINYGDTAGYRVTDLTYAGDLISKVGESLTSILDKIKNMLVEYEYFYNIDGQFVFQKKQSFISTMWSTGRDKDNNNISTLSEQIASTISYTFLGNELITSINTNPNINNVKNDYSIWGERESVTGAKIPIHFRYSINTKPYFYKTFDNYIFITNEALQKPELQDVITEHFLNNRYSYVDWREIIYQMAKDYYKHNQEDDFEFILNRNNMNIYKNGKTGYEIYYSDIEGFWRDLYYPEVETDFSNADNEYISLKNEVDNLQKFLYGENVAWSENKLGGLENDVNALNNLISNESAQVDSLIRFWNYGTGSPDTILYPANFIAPKYDFRDDNSLLISDPYLYLSMLQDLYFRKQSLYNSKKEQLDRLKEKRDRLEKYKNENYYLMDADIERRFWNRNVFEHPNLLNFWFDFLEADTSFGQYGVYNLGGRAKAIQDSTIKSIYFRETPQVIFKEPDEEYTWATGHRIIQVPYIDTMFSISAQGKSAKEKLDELLYQHTCIVETVSLSTVPIYYLEPNTRIKLYDKDTSLNGDYIINKITIPLSYNGTMSLQLIKAIEDIN